MIGTHVFVVRAQTVVMFRVVGSQLARALALMEGKGLEVVGMTT